MRSKVFVGLLAVGLFGCTVDPAPVWVPVSDYMAIDREGLSISDTTIGAIVTGGNLESEGSTNFAEAFDPRTRSWKPLPDVRGILTSCGETQRRDHQATIMPDGRILITGGGFSMSTKSAVGCACAYNESDCVDAYSDSFVVFDPDEGRTAKCNQAPSLGNADTCVPGSQGAWFEGWSRSFKMRKRHAAHTVTLLSTDKRDVEVLLLGGSGKTIEDTLEKIHYKNISHESKGGSGPEVLCLAVDEWESQGAEKVENGATEFVTGHSATPMKVEYGQVRSMLVFGGVVARAGAESPAETGQIIAEGHAKRLEIAENKFYPIDTAMAGPGPRVGHFALRLDDRRILIAGGWNPDRESLSDAWILQIDPDGNGHVFRRIADMKYPHAFAAVTQWQDDVFVSGGYGPSQIPTKVVERFDAKSETWHELPAMNEARARHGMMRLPGKGSVFLATGGITSGTTLRVGELLYMNGPCSVSECSPGLICDVEEERCVPLD